MVNWLKEIENKRMNKIREIFNSIWTLIQRMFNNSFLKERNLRNVLMTISIKKRRNGCGCMSSQSCISLRSASDSCLASVTCCRGEKIELIF